MTKCVHLKQCFREGIYFYYLYCYAILSNTTALLCPACGGRLAASNWAHMRTPPCLALEECHEIDRNRWSKEDLPRGVHIVGPPTILVPRFPDATAEHMVQTCNPMPDLSHYRNVALEGVDLLTRRYPRPALLSQRVDLEGRRPCHQKTTCVPVHDDRATAASELVVNSHPCGAQ